MILTNSLPWQSIFDLNKLFYITSLKLLQSFINLVVVYDVLQMNALLLLPPSMTLHFLSW